MHRNPERLNIPMSLLMRKSCSAEASTIFESHLHSLKGIPMHTASRPLAAYSVPPPAESKYFSMTTSGWKLWLPSALNFEKGAADREISIRDYNNMNISICGT